MKVRIKQLSVEMEIKTKGIELGVHSPDGKRHLGDLVIKNGALIWCRGQTRPEGGKRIPWNKFIEWAQSQ